MSTYMEIVCVWFALLRHGTRCTAPRKTRRYISGRQRQHSIAQRIFTMKLLYRKLNKTFSQISNIVVVLILCTNAMQEKFAKQFSAVFNYMFGCRARFDAALKANICCGVQVILWSHHFNKILRFHKYAHIETC